MSSFVACALVILAVVTPSLAQTKAAFCREYDCPLFTSENANGYEIRTLTQDTWWVESTITSNSRNMNWFDSSRVFRKLFNYINGNNAANLKMKMTVPVLTKVADLQNGQYDLTMMFFISGTARPPTPSDSSVTLSSFPAGSRFFVRNFTKWMWATSRDWANNLAALKESIGDASAYNDMISYTAGYDAPFSFRQRRFEVWLQ